MTKPLVRIKDSEVANSHFPECLCAYQNGSTFMMVEVNTGLRIGSLKPVSKVYHSIEDMRRSYDISKSIYPVIEDHLIYNDRISKI